MSGKHTPRAVNNEGSEGQTDLGTTAALLRPSARPEDAALVTALIMCDLDAIELMYQPATAPTRLASPSGMTEGLNRHSNEGTGTARLLTAS